MTKKPESESAVERPEGVDPSRPVGYGNPPKRTQFQKGQSGNKRGRPKGSLNARSLFEKRMSEPVTITTGSASRTIPALDAGMLRLRNDMIQGKPKAFATVFALMREFGCFQDRTSSTDDPLVRLAPEVFAAHVEAIRNSIQSVPEESSNCAGESDGSKQKKEATS